MKIVNIAALIGTVAAAPTITSTTTVATGNVLAGTLSVATDYVCWTVGTGTTAATAATCKTEAASTVTMPIASGVSTTPVNAQCGHAGSAFSVTVASTVTSVSFIQCHGKYVKFTCNGSGTTTSIDVKEECDDAACGTCETTETKNGDGKCYVEGTKAHVATCGGTTTATVQIWAAGTACGAGATAPAGAAADTDTHASGVCQIDDHGYVTRSPKNIFRLL